MTRIGHVFAVAFLAAATACGAPSDSEVRADGIECTGGDRSSVSDTLTSSEGWIEAGELDFGNADPPASDRRRYNATHKSVRDLRPRASGDKSRSQVDGGSVSPLKDEMAAGATVAMQLVPSQDGADYALRTVALRKDGSVRWVGGCDARFEGDVFAAYIASRRASGDSSTAAEVLRELLSSNAERARQEFETFERARRGQPAWSARPASERFIYEAPPEVRSHFVSQIFNIELPASWRSFGGSICGRVSEGWAECARISAGHPESDILPLAVTRPRQGALELWLLNPDDDVRAPVARLARLQFDPIDGTTDMNLFGDPSISDRETLIREGRRRDVIVPRK